MLLCCWMTGDGAPSILRAHCHIPSQCQSRRLGAIPLSEEDFSWWDCYCQSEWHSVESIRLASEHTVSQRASQWASSVSPGQAQRTDAFETARTGSSSYGVNGVHTSTQPARLHIPLLSAPDYLHPPPPLCCDADDAKSSAVRAFLGYARDLRPTSSVFLENRRLRTFILHGPA